MYFGINDNKFTRNHENETVVPMTKSEIRAICLSKLMIDDGCVCWDIGAGTGSVTVEMAMAAPKGKVYAVEMKENALELIRANIKKFGLNNVEIVSGKAPEACRDLPAPDRVFIGGSSDNAKEIISFVLSKNPDARIVASAVSLESLAEFTSCMKEFGFSDSEVISVQVARSKKAGDYSLMTALNPVYIFSMQK